MFVAIRLGLVVSCLAFLACGSSPDPKTASDEDRAASTKRKKKKKKKRKTAEEIEAEERAAEKVRAHQEDRRRVAEARKKSSPFGRTSRDDRDDEEEVEDSPAKTQQSKAAPKPVKTSRPAKAVSKRDQKPARKIDEGPDDSDEVTIIEDDEIEPDPVRKAKAKPAAKKKPPAKKVAKKPARDEEIDDEDVAVTDTRKGVEKPRTARPVREPELDDDSEEADEPPPKVAARAKKKPVVAAKAKPKPEPKRAPRPEPEDEIEIEIDEPEPEPRRPARSQAEILSADTEEDDPLKERRVAAIAVPGVDDGESDEPDEEELPPGAWPMQIGERPLTIAKDKLAVHGGLRISSLTIRPPGGTPATTNTTSLALGAAYGLGDKLEVGLDYAPGISPASAKGPLTLHGAYRAAAGPKLELAIAGGFALDFAEITNAMMETVTVSSYAVVLGAWARYRIDRKTSLFTGLPATPGVPVSLSKLAFPLPPLPYQATIGLSDGSPVAVDVPLGAGYQLRPNVYLFGALNLAHIRVRNTANAFLFADIIPLTAGGFYTRKTMDIGVQLSDDLRSGTDNLRLDLLVRYGVK